MRMVDQFGTHHDLANLRGDVAVVVFADRQGAESSRALGSQLHLLFHPTARGLSPGEGSRAPVRHIPDWPEHLHLPDVKVIAVACIGEVPWLLQSFVRSRFRSAVPDLPIWLDMTDYMRKHFGVTPGVPNVIVFDTASQQLYRIAGELNETQVNQLVEIIENARRDVLPK